MRVALLTNAREPTLVPEDRLAAEALAERGIDVVAWVWDGADVGHVDAAVVRSCWDYHEKVDAFTAFVEGLGARGTHVFNTPDIVRWNIDKGYLKELAAHGARIPRTAWVPRASRASLREVLEASDLDEVVVKPRVSLSAVDTFRASRREAPAIEPRFAALVAEKALLVQEFVPEIREGEVSLVFLGGRFSHAVRKTPRQGDFRVQEEYGGTRVRIEPRSEWIAEAERIVSTLPPLVYARADVVEAPQGLVWMELEAIDPELFLPFHAEGPARFAAAIDAALREGDGTPSADARR